MFQRLKRIAAPAAIAILLAVPVSAYAAPSASGTTAPSGSLASGATDAFTFAYPGDGSQAIIKLNFGPADPIVASQVNFAVYAPDGTQLGQGTDQGNGPGFDALQFSTTTQGTYTVKVFNFAPNSVNFTLEPQGFAVTPENASPTATVATASASPTAAPASSANASTSKTLGATPISGKLDGNAGGSYATYPVDYAGNGASLTIKATIDPSVVQENGSGGVNVYDANGNLVGSATAPAPGQLSFVLTGSPAGTYTVQVFNYDQTTAINYTLSESNS